MLFFKPAYVIVHFDVKSIPRSRQQIKSESHRPFTLTYILMYVSIQLIGTYLT